MGAPQGQQVAAAHAQAESQQEHEEGRHEAGHAHSAARNFATMASSSACSSTGTPMAWALSCRARVAWAISRRARATTSWGFCALVRPGVLLTPVSRSIVCGYQG